MIELDDRLDLIELIKYLSQKEKEDYKSLEIMTDVDCLLTRVKFYKKHKKI